MKPETDSTRSSPSSSLRLGTWRSTGRVAAPWLARCVCISRAWWWAVSWSSRWTCAIGAVTALTWTATA